MWTTEHVTEMTGDVLVALFQEHINRKISLSAEAAYRAEGAGACQTVPTPLGKFWVIAKSGINQVFREPTKAPYSLMNTPKAYEFPSTNDLHKNVFWSWKLSVVHLEYSRGVEIKTQNVCSNDPRRQASQTLHFLLVIFCLHHLCILTSVFGFRPWMCRPDKFIYYNSQLKWPDCDSDTVS